MKHTLTALTLVLSFLLGACAGVPVITEERTLDKNSERIIGEYGFWRRDCSNMHFDILIEQYPKSGDLRFDVGSLVVPDNPDVGSAGKCAGKEIKSKKIVYIANPDFVGQDSVVYVVKSSFLLGQKQYDVIIDVE